jgi:signal transduction histidine kinase
VTAIARALVSAHCGTITAASAGACFAITLPAR